MTGSFRVLDCNWPFHGSELPRRTDRRSRSKQLHQHRSEIATHAGRTLSVVSSPPSYGSPSTVHWTPAVVFSLLPREFLSPEPSVRATVRWLPNRSRVSACRTSRSRPRRTPHCQGSLVRNRNACGLLATRTELTRGRVSQSHRGGYHALDSAVHLATVPDCHHHDTQSLILKECNDAILPDPVLPKLAGLAAFQNPPDSTRVGQRPNTVMQEGEHAPRRPLVRLGQIAHRCTV